jgi:cell division protease FtsH
MGHAIVASAIAGSDPVHKISIIPRGIGALGYTIQRPSEERFLMTRTELDNKMAMPMGGRAAEYLIYGHLSTGAADDLSKITDIARSIVARYGMELGLGHVAFDTDQPDIARSIVARYGMELGLGHVAFDTDQRSFLGPGGESLRQRNYSEDTAREIDCAVRKAAATAFARAQEILTMNRELLERSAVQLLRHVTLDSTDLGRLFSNIKPAPVEYRSADVSCAG